MAKSIDVSDLNIYYGDFLAVEDVNIADPRPRPSPPSSARPAAASRPSCAR